MSNLDIIEAATGGPFTYLLHGEVHTAPLPVDLPYMSLLELMQCERIPTEFPMAEWLRERLFSEWAAHHDLPTFEDCQRLAYVVDHYRSSLVYDFQTYCSGADLGELWRSRRWRTMLDLIDHLPSHSWYSAAVSSDEEHAKALAESMASREQADGESRPSGPPLQSWTPEVAAITDVVDAVNRLTHVLIVVNHDGKGPVPEAPKPLPRPHTPLEGLLQAAKFENRKKRHDALAARVLPHKANPQR